MRFSSLMVATFLAFFAVPFAQPAHAAMCEIIEDETGYYEVCDDEDGYSEYVETEEGWSEYVEDADGNVIVDEQGTWDDVVLEDERDFFADDEDFFDDEEFFGDEEIDPNDDGYFDDNADSAPEQNYTDSDLADNKLGKTPATPGAQPWMVAQVAAGDSNAYTGQECGGSLIAAQWVLTAAHCVENMSPSDINMVVGRHTLSSNEGERIGVAQIINHPGYAASGGNDHDIALIKLARPATAGTPIGLVTAATTHLDNPGVVGKVTGWGQMGENDERYPDGLHQVTVPLISQDKCKTQNGADAITPGMICAGLDAGGQDSCKGDSGGPLTVSNDSGTGQVLAGVVSWGIGCGAPNSPGVYTRVSEYTNWIQQNMK